MDPEKPFDWLCDDLKRRISEQGKPECLIGVSSGAALIWKLLHERAWEGPTVLLSPALRRYMQPLVTPPVGRGIIFHGERDSVVAIEDSVTAIAGSEGRFQLERCPDEEHALKGIFTRPTFAKGARVIGPQVAPLTLMNRVC